MDQSLFRKYAQKIAEKENEARVLCTLIKEKTGITVTAQQIRIDKKTISLFVSSAVRARLHQTHIETVLSAAGYAYKV